MKLFISQKIKNETRKSKVKKLLKLNLLAVFYTFFSYSQTQQNDSVKKIEEILIAGVRANNKNPITFTNLTKTQIAPRNLGQDIPILLNYLPSVVTTTDAGTGIGYTYMRVRGADGSRINVTLNGIPFNDSESQGTYFVNLPDFASSLESIQLQRGVGTSTSGAGAFGASLNLQTKASQKNAYAEIANSIGSFNTRKHTLAFGTGLNNNFEMNARLSKIDSDGYIDRAFSNLFGYYFDANYITNGTIIKAIAFGGKEKTYQSWNGLEDEEKLKNDRTFNSIGQYYDANGKLQFYDNETDNYWQNHFQLHVNQKITDKFSTNLAFHYTKGKGYFEQYKVKEKFANYNLPNFNSITKTDLVRKRWLDNHFFGTTFSANYKTENTELVFGGSANKYQGKHYGEVVWSEFPIAKNYRYYDNFGNKDEVNFYTKASQKINSFNFFIDLQYRTVFYKANSVKFSDVNDTFKFFNPKAGLNYNFDNKNTIYVYAGIANKEPRRDDYENETAKPEKLIDYEIGFKHQSNQLKVNLNAFYMTYTDQLVLTGALNDVGNPIFANSGKSYRAGFEFEAAWQVNKYVVLSPNVTVSANKNQDFYFKRDGVLTNLGNTNIAFSPNLIASNNLTILPLKSLQLAVLTKHVSKQFMGNIDSDKSVLNDYTIFDFNLNYELTINKTIKSIVFSGLVNNFLNRKYESNGYFYTFDDDYSAPPAITTVEGAGFYPQAGINYLLGVSVKF